MIIYLMNKSQQVVKAYSVDNAVEAKVAQGINEANKLTLSVPLNDRLDSNIFYALIPTDDRTNYLMFKLNDESIENDRITYTGIDAAYDELRGYAYIKEIRPVNRTAKEILQLILKDTRWEVGYIDSSNTVSTSFYYQPVLECIQQVVQLFNVEVTFTYSFNTKTHEITARQVNVYKQQGRRTGKRFEYGSNLLTVTREEDSQDIVTALVGRGKGEEKLDEDTGEATGGYSRRIGFKDVVWSKANGDPTDKPAGQEYVENPEATKIFGYDDGTPRIGIVIFEDIEDPAELLQATWASLLSSCRPKVSFKASVTDTGDLRLGDTIAIIRHELGIEYFTRVFKVVRDLKNEQDNTVEMGDDLSQKTLTSYVTDISNTANKAVQQANDAFVSAGSKNKTFYSATKPRIASEGDNLYLSLGNGEFEYWVWHNNQWQFIQSTQELNVVKQNVKQAQDDIKKTNEDLEKSKEDFNKSFGDLGESVVNFKGSLNDLDKEVKANTKNISDNYTTVVGKISDLGQTSVNKGEFSQLSQTVKGISTSVENNSSDISTLKQTAEGLQTQVSDNSDKLITISQTVNGVKVTAEDGIEKYTELSQTVDGLKSKVDQGINQSEIQQLKDQIGLKVSKGDVVSELNLEAGRTLISSNKIVLDADSVIFNGKAFIPDAAISGISADKINAGTLDAGKISVVNINADNIVAGTLSGKNINMNLTTGDIRFTAGRFHNADDTFDINIDENYIFSEGIVDKFWNEKSNLLIKDGQLTLTQDTWLDPDSKPYLRIYRDEGFAIGGVAGNALAQASVIAGNESIALAQNTLTDEGIEEFHGPFYEQKDKDGNWVQSYFNSDFVGVGVSRPYGSGMFLNKVPYAIYISSKNMQTQMSGAKITIEGSGNTGDAGDTSSIEIGTKGWLSGLSQDNIGTDIAIKPGKDLYLSVTQTTGNSANLYLEPLGGRALLTTSASKYKQDIVRSHSTEYGEKLLNVPVATWRDKSEIKRCAETGEQPKTYYGMIAEDLDEAGLSMLVTKSKGEVTGINYDRIGVALVPVIKELKDKINELEEKVNEQSKSN